MRELPQPLKTLSLLWVVAVLATVVLLPVHHVAWGLEPVGVVAILTGLTLASDYRGGATAMAQALRARAFRGPAFSSPVLTSRTSVRLYGGLAVMVGVALVSGATLFR